MRFEIGDQVTAKLDDAPWRDAEVIDIAETPNDAFLVSMGYPDTHREYWVRMSSTENVFPVGEDRIRPA